MDCAKNGAQERVIERLEKVLNFMKGVNISNDESLDHITKPLDDLEDSLKYIPNGPFFNGAFPVEIKRHILRFSHSCDSKAFIVASVCQDWKNLLEGRFKEKEVVIGGKCSLCEAYSCVKSVDMIKAAVAHKIDSYLVIARPVLEVDSQLVADALSGVSRFTIVNYFEPNTGFFEYRFYKRQTMSDDQIEHVFRNIERGVKTKEEVKLLEMNLQGVNQEVLANCLVSKVKRLTLVQYCLENLGDRMLDIQTFCTKLQQDSVNLKLTHLTMKGFSFFEDDSISHDGLTNVANALCNVENLKWENLKWSGRSPRTPVSSQIVERLLKNIVQRPTFIKTLILDLEDSKDFRSIISPQDVKTLCNKMATLQLEGLFTDEQLEAARSLPNVEVEQRERGEFMEVDPEQFFNLIKKGSNEMF